MRDFWAWRGARCLRPRMKAICQPSNPISLPAWPHTAEIPKNDTNICQLPNQEASSSRGVCPKPHKNESGLTIPWPSAVTLPVCTWLLAVPGGALNGSHFLASWARHAPYKCPLAHPHFLTRPGGSLGGQGELRKKDGCGLG